MLFHPEGEGREGNHPLYTPSITDGVEKKGKSPKAERQLPHYLNKKQREKEALTFVKEQRVIWERSKRIGHVWYRDLSLAEPTIRPDCNPKHECYATQCAQP